MAGKFNSRIKLLGILLFLCTATVNAQLLKDSATMDLVRKDIDYIYKLQFDNARETYTKIIQSYSGHPIVYLLKGLMTYWENYPLLRTSPSRNSFEEDLRQCIKLSEKNNNPDYEAEYLLANLCAKGMLLTFYADNDLIMEVIPLTISTYKNVRHAFDFTSQCTDLYYFTGIYNYYREEYPKIYPVYKSLALLFPAGNIEKGLKQLHTSAKSSIVMRAESCFLLNYIYLNFENKYSESLYYCRTLYELYPENELYLATYIKNLLLMKQYDEAEKLLSSSSETEGNRYYKSLLLILKGILQEKFYHQYELAEQYYNEGINESSLYGGYSNEFAAYAYFGLSRISDAKGEKKTSNTYRKQALKLADFKKIDFDK